MSQSIQFQALPSPFPFPSPTTLGRLTRNIPGGRSLSTQNVPWGPEFDSGGKLQKFNIRGGFLLKIAFSVSIQKHETEFAFSFKNSEICSNVL